MQAESNTDDIAFALGYSDARSLRRAIKLAGGLSLAEVRTTPLAGPAPTSEPVLLHLRRELMRQEA